MKSGRSYHYYIEIQILTPNYNHMVWSKMKFGRPTLLYEFQPQTVGPNMKSGRPTTPDASPTRFCPI